MKNVPSEKTLSVVSTAISYRPVTPRQKKKNINEKTVKNAVVIRRRARRRAKRNLGGKR